MLEIEDALLPGMTKRACVRENASELIAVEVTGDGLGVAIAMFAKK